jgi:glycine dehydrogenase
MLSKYLAQKSFKAVSKTAFRAQSTLNKVSELSMSKVILNKQLQYLANSKISESLKPSDSFIPRHLGNNDQNTRDILKTIGVGSLEELMDQVVPPQIRLTQEQFFRVGDKELHGIHSETMMLARLSKLSFANKVNRSFQGTGYYPTQLPSVIRRNVLENPNWYTPYTPYQAEIA